MKIAIVDDLPAERTRLTEMLTAELHATHTDIHKLDTFESAEPFLDQWTDGKYDLVLLDIYMGGATGVEAARKIRQTDENVHLVFCTTSNEFASESYALGISYYLHKPYSADDLRRMIRKVRPKDYELTRYILLPDGQKLILRTVTYTQYDNHVISIFRKQLPTLSVRMSQGDFEALIADAEFIVPCSKGLTANLYEVERIEGSDFLMKDGNWLPISRRKFKDIQKIYDEFLFRKMRKEMLL